MKRLFIRVSIAMLVLCSVPAMRSGAYADTMIIGWKGWYTNWQPGGMRIMDKLTTASYAYGRAWIDLEKDVAEGYLTGPTMGYQIGDWSLGVSCMFINKFDYKMGGIGYDFSIANPFPVISRTRMNRSEIDVSLSYSIFNWLKVFAGYKYQRLSYNIWHLMGFIFMAADNQYDLHMPTAGLAIYIPILDNLNIGIQAGALYLIPYSSNESAPATTNEIMYTLLRKVSDLRLEPAFGFNSEAMINYILMERVIIQLGYRYQIFRLHGTTRLNEYHLPGVSSGSALDVFQGVTCAVSYALSTN